MDDDFATIEHGTWDAEDWETCQQSYPRVRELELDLLVVASLGPWLLADTFHVLHKANPKLRGQTHPRAALNRQIAEGLIDGLGDLRKHTLGDPMMASVALAQLGPTLTQLLADAQRVQEAADEAADAAQAQQEGEADAAEREAAGQGPNPDVDLDALAAAAERTARTLADETAAMGPVVTAAVAAGAEAATETVTQLRDAAAGLGIDVGESVDTPADRLALLERINGDRLRDLAKMVGRLRIEAGARVGTNWASGPGEITDVTRSDNLSRMVSSELVHLAVPELRYAFYDRLLNKQLLCLHMEEPQHEDSGTIIYVEDSSTTMAGLRTLWARAVGYRLLETAIAQRRGFRAIVFSGPGSFRVFDFGDDASTSSVEDRLAYAEFAMAGETDFQGPLTSALTFIEDEVERLGRTHADIVLATDGIATVDADFQELFDARKLDHGFRCFGIMIQHPVTPVMVALCDSITSEDRLEDGANIADLFDQLTPALVAP